jgi:hypothetical protein
MRRRKRRRGSRKRKRKNQSPPKSKNLKIKKNKNRPNLKKPIKTTMTKMMIDAFIVILAPFTRFRNLFSKGLAN